MQTTSPARNLRQMCARETESRYVEQMELFFDVFCILAEQPDGCKAGKVIGSSPGQARVLGQIYPQPWITRALARFLSIAPVLM